MPFKYVCMYSHVPDISTPLQTGKEDHTQANGIRVAKVS